MGGFGSGKKSCRKTTVEECLTLSMKGLVKPGKWGDGQTGLISWTWPGGHEAKAGFVFDLSEGKTRLWLSYTVTDRDGQHDYNYPIIFASEPCRLGGQQWFFRCPRKECQQRVRQLHKPPSDHLFACRNCHNLTYTSVQEHDNRVKRLREDPEALERALNGSTHEQFLALKAMRDRN